MSNQNCLNFDRNGFTNGAMMRLGKKYDYVKGAGINQRAVARFNKTKRLASKQGAKHPAQ